MSRSLYHSLTDSLTFASYFLIYDAAKHGILFLGAPHARHFGPMHTCIRRRLALPGVAFSFSIASLPMKPPGFVKSHVKPSEASSTESVLSCALREKKSI